VLPDGASSIYGANAIAGVINFVTRENFQGFQANASVGVADGYSAFNAAVMAGTDWGTGGAYVAFEHKDNTYLMAKDRSYTKMDLTSIGGRDSRGTSCDLANITVPGAQHARFAKGRCRWSVSQPERTDQCRFAQPLRHQFLRLAFPQGRTEYVLRPVPSADRARRRIFDQVPLVHAPGFGAER
jgi:hypothetical protein